MIFQDSLLRNGLYKNRSAKAIPMRSKWLPRVSQELNCSSTLAGVSYNSLVRLAEQSKCHGRLPLVNAIMSTILVSNYSSYWPIYGRNTNYIDFTMGMQNPYEVTPPHVIRTMPISREHRYRTTCTRQSIFITDMFPLFVRSCRYLRCWKNQRPIYSVFYCPQGGILCIFLDPARTRCVSTVCVFFTLNRSFYFLLVDIQAHPVSTLILRPREIQALVTKLLHTQATLYQVDSSSTMPCHCAGLWDAQHTYASYPDTMKRDTKQRRRNYSTSYMNK